MNQITVCQVDRFTFRRRVAGGASVTDCWTLSSWFSTIANPGSEKLEVVIGCLLSSAPRISGCGRG